MSGIVSVLFLVTLKILGFIALGWVETIAISACFFLISVCQPRIAYIKELADITSENRNEIDVLECEIDRLKSELSELEDDYHNLNKCVNPEKIL